MIICAVFVLVDPYHGQFFSDKPIEESDCDQNAEYKCPVRPWHLKKKISPPDLPNQWWSQEQLQALSSQGQADCQCAYGAIVQRGHAPPLHISPLDFFPLKVILRDLFRRARELARRENIWSLDFIPLEPLHPESVRRESVVSGAYFAGDLGRGASFAGDWKMTLS